MFVVRLSVPGILPIFSADYFSQQLSEPAQVPLRCSKVTPAQHFSPSRSRATIINKHFTCNLPIVIFHCTPYFGSFTISFKELSPWPQLCRYLGFSEILFLWANAANLPNLSNLPEHMDECVHLIAGLLGHIYKYDPPKHVQMLNMSNGRLVLFQWLNVYDSSTRIRQISHPSEKDISEHLNCFLISQYHLLHVTKTLLK